VIATRQTRKATVAATAAAVAVVVEALPAAVWQGSCNKGAKQQLLPHWLLRLPAGVGL
jgi:hypothetical protein